MAKSFAYLVAVMDWESRKVLSSSEPPAKRGITQKGLKHESLLEP